MYKFTSIVLSFSVLVLGVFLGVSECDHDATKKKYNTAIVELEGIRGETETAKSIRALVEEDLKAQARALQEIINDRDEEILAQAKVSLRLKDRLFKATNAIETAIIEEGEFIDFLDKCEGYDKVRHRVDFEAINRPMRVVGYTLTNPPEAEVKLDWVEEFQLEINLTRDDDGNFRVYTDSEELKIGDIVLKVDPEVLKTKWYEKIYVGADIAAGSYGAQLALRPGYDVFNDLGVNFVFVVQYDESPAKTFYGGGVIYYPWR